MNKEEIEIQILPDGRIAYAIKGVKGQACEGISELLEQLGHVEEAERTSDYYAGEGDVDLHVSDF